MGVHSDLRQTDDFASHVLYGFLYFPWTVRIRNVYQEELSILQSYGYLLVRHLAVHPIGISGKGYRRYRPREGD